MPTSKPLSSTAQAVLEAAAQRDDRHAFPPARLPAAAKRAVGQSLIKAGLLEEIAAEEAGPAWRVLPDGERFALRATEAGLAAVGVEPTRMPEIRVDDAGEAAPASSNQDGPTDEPTAAEAKQAAQPTPRSARLGLRSVAEAVIGAWDDPVQERSSVAEAVEALRAALAGPKRAPTRLQPEIPRQPRADTKRAAVLALLGRPGGATVAQVAEATGWATHTVRGFFAGLKKAGVPVEVLERVKQVGPGNQGTKGSYTVYRVAGAA